MQVFKRAGVAFAIFAAATLCGLTAPAFAHEEHHAKNSSTSKRTELGTSAAVDGKGNLWVVSKETAPDGQYVVLQMSSDRGKTWTQSRRVQREAEPISADGENRPKIAFGSKDEIYITYTKPLAKAWTGEIRFVRSTDGGNSFAPPVTVHANRDIISHRFESLIVDRQGRVYVAWSDKREVEAAAARKKKYAGAALYYAVSEDGGATFKGDYKVADHSCECCRIALALDPQGGPIAFWRHVFEPNARDHAIIKLTPDGKLPALQRATFDDWRIDACPHQGPGLAISADGTRHQVWFSGNAKEGGVFYSANKASGPAAKPMRLGSAQAAHADVAVQGSNLVLAWKQFDGKFTTVRSKLSHDGGLTWQDQELARTQGASDQPRLLSSPSGIMLVWRTQAEGIRTVLTDRR